MDRRAVDIDDCGCFVNGVHDRRFVMTVFES